MQSGNRAEAIRESRGTMEARKAGRHEEVDARLAFARGGEALASGLERLVEDGSAWRSKREEGGVPKPVLLSLSVHGLVAGRMTSENGWVYEATPLGRSILAEMLSGA